MNSLFVIVFVAVLVTVLVRMFRYGGVTGMMVGARTQEMLGTVEGRAAGNRRVNVVVHHLEGQRPLGIHFTGRAYMSVERIAGSLSRDDARRLAEALDMAATEGADHG